MRRGGIVLARRQDGSWCGELKRQYSAKQTTFDARAVGAGRSSKIPKAAHWMCGSRTTIGGGRFIGWAVEYFGGEDHFGIPLAGCRQIHPAMVRPARKILRWAASPRFNSSHKMYLCFFGQYDYDGVPAIPPEIRAFPNWFGSTSTKFPSGRDDFLSWRFDTPEPSRRFRMRWVGGVCLLAGALSRACGNGPSKRFMAELLLVARPDDDYV